MSAAPSIPLCVRNLSVDAPDHRILEDLSFDLSEREIVSVVGPSGSGKTTLLRILNRFADRESRLKVSGEIYYRGRDIFGCCAVTDLRKSIGLVFQKPCVFPGSITHNVLFGVKHHQKLSRHSAETLTEEVLTKAHLWKEVKDRLKKPAHILSLGQRQRLAFARVLAVEPEILLLDEPTSSLDPHSTQEIENALLEMKVSKTILLVTHDLAQGRRVSDRVIFLSASSGPGKIIEIAPTNTFFYAPKEIETKQYIEGGFTNNELI